MTEHDLSRIGNDAIYPDGRVYWRDGYGWTSTLWQRLASLGWVSWRTPAGLWGATDPTGNRIATGCIGRAAGLLELARLIR
jgi:hypothetical protein